MIRRPLARSPARTLIVAAAVMLAVGGGTDLAGGEQVLRGDLIVSLDGDLSPLRLPRDHPAPVRVRLSAGLKSADGGVLPRVTGVKVGMPGQGVIDSRGLPICPVRRLRDATTAEALANCRSALVGRGRVVAQVRLPHQRPIWVRATVRAFNGRIAGRQAVILHAAAGNPPATVVLPLAVRHVTGRFGTELVGRLSTNLGPIPRLARLEVELHRRYVFKGVRHSFLSASCPIPRSVPAAVFAFAKATFTLAGGRRVSSRVIPRSCRART